MRHLIPFLGLGLIIGAAVWWVAPGLERGGYGWFR